MALAYHVDDEAVSEARGRAGKVKENALSSAVDVHRNCPSCSVPALGKRSRMTKAQVVFFLPLEQGIEESHQGALARPVSVKVLPVSRAVSLASKWRSGCSFCLCSSRLNLLADDQVFQEYGIYLSRLSA